MVATKFRVLLAFMTQYYTRLEKSGLPVAGKSAMLEGNLREKLGMKRERKGREREERNGNGEEWERGKWKELWMIDPPAISINQIVCNILYLSKNKDTTWVRCVCVRETKLSEWWRKDGLRETWINKVTVQRFVKTRTVSLIMKSCKWRYMWCHGSSYFDLVLINWIVML